MELVAVGRTAEVFAIDDDRVLKLDRLEWNGVSHFEADVLQAACAAGLPVPVYDVDLRSVLPTISVPTLVVARPQSDDRMLSQSRYVAEHISAAKYVELPAGEHLMAALAPIEEFVTGRHPAVAIDRVLATICSPISWIPRPRPRPWGTGLAPSSRRP